jgi:hypothetical protein
MIKKEAEDRGLKESSAEIPTCGVKLALSHNAMEILACGDRSQPSHWEGVGHVPPTPGKDLHCNDAAQVNLSLQCPAPRTSGRSLGDA